MIANKLRHRIKVYSQSLVSDGCGGQTETFTLKGECWSEIIGKDPASNDERYDDRKIETVNEFKINTRFNIGFVFEQTDVIFFGTRFFRIQGITNAFEHDYKYSVSCYEIENDSVVIV